MNFKQNYKEKLAQEKTQKTSAGLVAERYNSASSITFQLTYYQSSFNKVLMTRTLNFIPSNYAYFHLTCMKSDCVNGGFDLTSIVDTMYKNREQRAKGVLFCNGKKTLPAGTDIAGHARLLYEVTIHYAGLDKDAA